MARTPNIENEELKTTEIDMTEAEADEVLKADMAANEVDYLAGLLNAAEDAEDETKKIEIVRNGKTYFAFSIHSLPDETLYEIRAIYFHKHGKIQRSVYLKNICLFDVKFRFQNLQQAFIHLILYFQTDNLTPLTFL